MASKEPNEAEKGAIREGIVDAAEKLFFSRGYDSVTLEQIAGEAGIDKATLLRVIQDKESAFFAVGLRGARILRGIYVACSQIDGDGFTRLNAMIDGFAGFANDYPGYYRLLSLAGEERFCKNSFPGEDRRVRFSQEGVELGMMSSANLELVAEAIERGKADGSIRADLNSRQAAILLGVLQGGILERVAGWKCLAGEIGEDQMQEELRRFIGHAVAGPATRPAAGKDGKRGIAWPWNKTKRPVK